VALGTKTLRGFAPAPQDTNGNQVEHEEDAAHAASIDAKRWQTPGVNTTVRALARVAEAVGVTCWDLVRPSRRRRAGSLR
jgi:hypothetical protein